MSRPRDARLDLVHPDVQRYLERLSPADDPLIDRLEAHARARSFPLVGRESGRWLERLTRVIRGRRVFEFGSGFGYSAFFFARAVGEGGEVVGADRDAHEIEAHRELFAGHALASRIRLEVGDAFDVLAGTEGPFDVVFLDLDKERYVEALDAAVPRLRPGGLLLADNALWGGKVAFEPDSEATDALVRFNARLAGHPALDAGILPIGDGLAVALRR